jgi:hypothetical protein
LARIDIAMVVVAALAGTGCAEIRVRTVPEVVRERVVNQYRETEVMPGVTSFFTAEDRGTRLELTFVHTCARRSYREVERTARYAHYDTNAGENRALGITGGAIAALGAVLLALPATRADTDHKADLGAGIPITALGTSLAAASIAGLIQARQRKEVVEVVREDDGLVGDAPCRPGDGAAAGERVTAKVVGQEDAGILEGKTDDQGELELNLRALPAWLVKAAPEPKQLALFARGRPAGTVSLAPYVHIVEEKDWRDADIKGCSAPTSALSCTLLERFLEDYPESEHAWEARMALARGRAALRYLPAR